MPKVLLLCEYATLNGGERSLLAILDHLRSAGYEIVVAGPPSGPLARQFADRDIAVTPFETYLSDGTRRSQAELRHELSDIVNACTPDLLHANSLSMSRLSGPVVEALQIPSIAHVRDIVKLSANARSDVNRHGRIIAVSHATRRWHVAAGMSDEKTFVVYNGVDLERFRPRRATGCLHSELRLSSSVSMVGAIGQIGMRKGLDVLLDAASNLVAQTGIDVHLLVVGQRLSQKQEAVDFETRLHKTASAPPLTGRVHFLGVRDDVHRVLNELSLLVHAARQEPLGRVLLEAAAAGTPVVATDVGGTREIFPDNTHARIVPPDSPDVMADAIATLLNNPTTRRNIAATARRRAVNMFDARSAARALVDHYIACLR